MSDYIDLDLSDHWENIGGEEFLEFDKVDPKRSTRPDLHAFLMLDEKFPDTKDIVSGASHDEIYLSIDDEQVRTLTDAEIVELSRCGVRYDSNGSLCMFV